MKLFRSIAAKNGTFKMNYEFRPTMRAPGNVPYIIDNLWEWLRPENYPNRRFAAYASPSQELALKSGPDKGTAFYVEFPGAYKLAQLTKYPDSKFHPDCKGVKRKIISLLTAEAKDWWLNWDVTRKTCIGQLWIPCLTKEEVEKIFNEEPILKNIKDKVTSLITYWKDVELIDPETSKLTNSEGELFFEAKDGYRLVPIDQ